jgi:hypothetical protein
MAILANHSCELTEADYRQISEFMYSIVESTSTMARRNWFAHALPNSYGSVDSALPRSTSDGPKPTRLARRWFH